MTSTQVPVSLLRPHPENVAIYNDTASNDLIAHIRKNGIEHPLLITQDNRIISGHRRWAAAKAIGLATVPVRVFASTDELDILEELVISNRNRRERTNEQKAREGQALMRVESERAKRRQATSTGGNAPQLVETFPQAEDSGKARDRVGEALGVSGKTAEALVFVADTIDELSASGEADKAEMLRAALTKGAKTAAQEAKRLKPPTTGKGGSSGRRFQGKAERDKCSPAIRQAIDALLLARKKMNESAQAIVAVYDGPMSSIFEEAFGRLRGSAQQASASAKLNYFAKIDKLLSDLIPVAENCPFCEQSPTSTCAACQGSRIITKSVFQSLSQELQSRVKLIAD